MQDLNATMFYKAKFNIQTVDTRQGDMLWRLLLHIKSWLKNKWNQKVDIVDIKNSSWTRFKFGSKFFDKCLLGRIYAESIYHCDTENPDLISWACRIVEKPEAEPGYSPREWVTEIGYRATSKYTAEISYVVTYSDLAGFIGFCLPAPTPTVPRVIRTILNDISWKCYVGSDSISLNPTKLNPGDFPYLQEKIFDPDREVPLIYISPRRIGDSDEAQLLVDPSKIADSVAANAIVFYADSLEFTQEMSYFGNNNYVCTGGTIRIYFPKINLDDENDSSRHRFLSARFIEEYGEEKIIDLLRRAMAQDVHYYESLFRLKDCIALVDNDIRKAKIERIRAQSQTEADDALQAFMEESDRCNELEQKNIYLQEEIDQLKTENYQLNILAGQCRERASQVGIIENATRQVRSISEYPSDPQSIAKYFETVYPERIVFTERAYKSMEECRTKCELLWEIFYCMVTDLYDLLKSNPGKAYDIFREKTGWEIGRGEGTQTHCDQKMMREYYDWYEGQEINIEPHIKNGVRETDPKFVRVHFCYNPTISNKIIVGHCGKHLTNYSTQKARR